MSNLKRINVFVAAVSIAALSLLLFLDWQVAVAGPSDHWGGFFALLILGLISESMSVKMTGGGAGGTFTITFIPLLTSVLLFGPETAVLLFGVVGVVSEFLIHKKPLVRAAFNSSQYVVSSTLAGVAFTALGGVPILAGGNPSTVLLLRSFIGFGVVFLASNHALVAGAISLSRSLPFRKVWEELVGRSGTNILYDLLISPIAIAVAFLYQELQVWGLLTVLLPMLFIRHFYFLNYRLLKANQDLLSALVKAIETRDPYTSGHSVRVAQLARFVAEAMHLPSTQIERVAQSALLHDIGKIEAIYTDILGKPESLSEEEREVIESHVTKGEALLRTLSSVPAEVIADVRHHHERVDGKGYPDRIAGHAIPLGARIIKVCDAVDAMLSDRPYRKALKLETVREELMKYSGTQFDQEVVKHLVDSDVLDRHAAALAELNSAPHISEKRLRSDRTGPAELPSSHVKVTG